MNIKYDELLAKNYNSYHVQQDNLFKLQLSKIIYYLNLDTTKSVLDVGSGAGRLMVPLTGYVRHVHGVEYSENMYNETLNNLIQFNIQNYILQNMDYNVWLDTVETDKLFSLNAAYFSYTLHQIQPDPDKQIEVLNKTFALSDIDTILLITLSHKQIEESLLTKYNDKILKFDYDRYMTIDKIKEHFTVVSYEEGTNYYKMKKSDLLNNINNRYISFLQILNDDELKDYATLIDNTFDDIINYPDFYTYIVLKK